jgi:eukaryotic-like serine/threonine-protein kinase
VQRKREVLAVAGEHFDDDQTSPLIDLSQLPKVSQYVLVSKIGSGGVGEVYLAEDTSLNRNVALKFLSAHLCQDADCRARFKREAQAAAKLNHPNIVTVYEVSEYNCRPFFTMEYVEGQPLSELIKQGDCSLDKMIDLSLQICEGLQEAHKAGITHRDIKPANILVSQSGRAKLVDFGLAAVAGADKLTREGSTLGTLGYMSPEQVQGRPTDHRSDLFSFGVVLYELISCRSPFKGETPAATMNAITQQIPEPLTRYKAGVPVELQRIVSKLLQKDPALRYQTAADVISDLTGLKATSQLLTGAPVRKNQTWRPVFGVAVLVLLAVAAYGIFKSNFFTGKATIAQRKMLAVLPFENLSPDPDQEYFSDGLTEELTSKLSLVQSLCVISRSSSMTFKGSNKTIPEIAKALKVQYIVEGSVRRAGNELRITAQLIDANADFHLWSKTYAGTLDDVFDMQDSVSRAIVDGIRIELTPDETRRLGKRSFNNTAAFAYYLEGKAEIDRGTEDAIIQGMRYLQQGLDIVGDNALIYSGMAWGYWNMVNGGFAQDEDISKAEDYAKKSLNLDPELPEAHAMLGWINCAFLGNQRKAVEQFKEALAINPNSTPALSGLAIVYYSYVGKVSASLSLIERRNTIFPLDSLYTFVKQGGIALFTTNFMQAREANRKAYEIGLRDPVQTFFYAISLAYCDSVKEAFSVIDECVGENPTSSMINFLEVMRHALQKDKLGALERLTSDVQQSCRRDAEWSYHLGALLSLAGAKEEAWPWLENAVNRGFINYPFWEKDPFLDNIRTEERFKKLIERVKYEWEHFEV